MSGKNGKFEYLTEARHGQHRSIHRPSRGFVMAPRGLVPKDLFLGFLSLTLDKVMPGASRRGARYEGQGHATRDTPSAGKFRRVGKTRPRTRFALSTWPQFFCTGPQASRGLTPPLASGNGTRPRKVQGNPGHLLSASDACVQFAYRAAPRSASCGTPRLNNKRHWIWRFPDASATRFPGGLLGQIPGPISCCCNDMLSLDSHLEGTPSVPKSGEKWRFSSEI
jgi:hypothetical protein